MKTNKYTIEGEDLRIVSEKLALVDCPVVTVTMNKEDYSKIKLKYKLLSWLFPKILKIEIQNEN